MKQTLKESFERCRNQGPTVMKGITDLLDESKIPYRTNKKRTEIVTDKKKSEIDSLLEMKGKDSELQRFMVSTKERRGKTYLRLRYQ